jgi:hypothetical protein
MGTFHTKCKIENPTDRDRSLVIQKLLVDMGSYFTWVSERMLGESVSGAKRKTSRLSVPTAKRSREVLALRSSASTSFSLSMSQYSRNQATFSF